MNKVVMILLTMIISSAYAVDYTSESTVTTNNTNNSTSTSTVNSTNTNNNTTTSTSTVNSTNTNNNINTSTSTSEITSTSTNTNNNTNVNTNTNTNTNTNNNTNVNTSTTDSTVRNMQSGEVTTNINSPPPSAIAPQFSAGNNNDLCTVGVSGAVQTQILGISMGSTVRDLNCERLKNAKTLHDMGMKVAAVSTLCQDQRVFDAMMHAGTPCPFEGLIGDAARAAWEVNPELWPEEKTKKEEETFDEDTKKLFGNLGVSGVLGLLLLL